MAKPYLLVLALVSALIYSAGAGKIKTSQRSSVRRTHLRGQPTRKLIDIGSLVPQPDALEPADPADVAGESLSTGEEVADEEYEIVEEEGVDQGDQGEEAVETDSFITDLLGKIIGEEEEMVAVEETKDLFGSNISQEEEVVIEEQIAQEEGATEGGDGKDDEEKSLTDTIGDVSDGISDTVSTVSDGIDKTKETIGTIKDTVDEIAAVGDTAPSEWTTTQKWGVAITALVGFMIVSCVLRRLLCLR